MQVHAENDNTKPLNLLDVYMLAKGQDAQFAAAEAALRAGKEVLPQSRAALKPSLRLDGNTRYIDQTTKYSGNVPFPSGTQSYGSYHYTLKLIQPIYHKNSIEAYKQARLSVESSETQFNLAQQNLITRVAQAYFDVLLAKDTLTLTEAEISSNEEQLARSKRAFDIGSATIMDVREAQASYDLSRAREISAKNGLEIARQTLSKIIGTYPQALVSIAGELPLVPPEPAIMENWVTAAQEQNLNVRLAQLNLQIAGREIQRNRGLAYPSLDLVANYIGNNSSSSSYGAGVNTKEKNIGLELNVPLYSGGLVSSKTRELVAEKERSHPFLTGRPSERRSGLSAG